MLEINEITTYGSAWKRGILWEFEPNPIDVNYVTRAGFLWKNGEIYTVQDGVDAPLCWINKGVSAASDDYVSCGSGTIISTINEGIVTINVIPNEDTTIYAVEDYVSEYGYPKIISEGGVYDSINHKIKWGPWFDNKSRVLSYKLTPRDSFVGIINLRGHGSFDGVGSEIAGDRQYRLGLTEPNLIISLQNNQIILSWDVDGELLLENQKVMLQQSSTAVGPWHNVEGIGDLNIYTVKMDEVCMFYRLVIIDDK